MSTYFCRVTDSNNNLDRPSGVAKETGATHSGSFGFAYEEWLLNKSMNIDGYQYGWIEGFKDGTGRRIVLVGDHTVFLYARRGGQNFVIGKINICQKLDSTQVIHFPSQFVADAIAVGAKVSFNNNNWTVLPTKPKAEMTAYTQQCVANVKFKLSDVVLYETPKPIKIKATRFSALLIDGKSSLEDFAKLN